MRYYPVDTGRRSRLRMRIAEEPEATASANLAAFGSSEYAKVVLGGFWGTAATA